ncbi:FGGY family carbohydrate kinase, partial [Actinomadura bangladeshensis]
MAESLVAGVDSSTQSTKVVLCRAADGTVVAEASAPHPDGTECHPDHWWTALSQVRELLERADAVAVAAQQHGMVALDGAGGVVRPALLWNDTRSAPQARALVEELGGAKSWAERTGSVPLASFTVTKLRWMAENEPANARRTERVMLPHDWLTLRLGASEPVTDRGDASGTGYWSPAAGAYLPDVLRAALGCDAAVPR